jgi:hypothetical protein
MYILPIFTNYIAAANVRALIYSLFTHLNKITYIRPDTGATAWMDGKHFRVTVIIALIKIAQAKIMHQFKKTPLCIVCYNNFDHDKCLCI